MRTAVGSGEEPRDRKSQPDYKSWLKAFQQAIEEGRRHLVGERGPETITPVRRAKR